MVRIFLALCLFPLIFAEGKKIDSGTEMLKMQCEREKMNFDRFGNHSLEMTNPCKKKKNSDWE